MVRTLTKGLGRFAVGFHMAMELCLVGEFLITDRTAVDSPFVGILHSLTVSLQLG